MVGCNIDDFLLLLLGVIEYNSIKVYNVGDTCICEWEYVMFTCVSE